MRDVTSMAVVVGERDRPSPKVWQPWYMEESDGSVGKELPTRAHRDQRARDRLALPRHPHRPPGSPERDSSSEEDEINVVDSPPPTTDTAPTLNTTPIHPFYGHAYYALMDDDDGPLDMSTKRRSPTPTRHAHHTNNSPSPPPYHPRPTYLPAPARVRPSVITCVPPRYLEAAPRELPPPYTERPLPPPYSIATAHLNQQRAVLSRDCTPISARVPIVTPPAPINPAHREALRQEDPPLARRQVVQAGPVDPEIDEHFRRSLGKEYQRLFSLPSTPVPSTDSVDDHFAKALGETWVKLQAERRDNNTTTSTSTTTTTTTKTKSTTPPPPPPPPFPSITITTTTTTSTRNQHHPPSSSSTSSTSSPPPPFRVAPHSTSTSTTPPSPPPPARLISA